MSACRLLICVAWCNHTVVACFKGVLLLLMCSHAVRPAVLLLLLPQEKNSQKACCGSVWLLLTR
jgi:hypothetical protein